MSANTTPLARGVAQPGTAGAANKPAAGTDGAGAASSEDASGQGGQSEQVTIGKDVLETLKRQAAGQSALLRRLTQELDEVKGRLSGKPEGEEGDGKKQYKSPYMRQLAELNDFKAKVETERTEMLKDATRQQIYSGLVAKGIDAKVAGLVAESLHGRVSSRVSPVKDSLGRTVLEIKGASPEEESVQLDAWLDAFVQSDEGKALFPPEPNPSLRGVPIRRGGTPEGKIRITKDDLKSGRFDMEAMKAGKVVVTDA